MLPAKLKFKNNQPLHLINAPDDISKIFSGFQIKYSIAGESAIQVLLFAYNKKELDKHIIKLFKNIDPQALLWIAYPKKSGSITSDLIRDEGWTGVWEAGWEGVASASIDNDWSAMRFRSKEQTHGLKRLLPVEERSVQGIDFINRTVVDLPADAKTAMKPFKGLETFFNSMSFTHKKEYVESIVEAKKPETRQRRIDKMIEMVLQLQEKKQGKLK